MNQMPTIETQTVQKREKRGAFAVLLSLANAGGVMTFGKGAMIAALALMGGGAYMAGSQFGAARMAQAKAETRRQVGWSFAEAKKADQEHGISAAAQAPAQASAAGGSAALSMVAGANSGKLKDPVDALLAGAAKGDAVAENDAAVEGEAAEKDPAVADGENLLSGIGGMMEGIKKGELPDGGFGKLRDSLNGGKGFGQSGGILRGFDKPQMGNKILEKARLQRQAAGKAKGFNKSRKARIKKAARSKAGKRASLSGANARRLSRMQSAMAPTAAGGDSEGNHSVHQREWSGAAGSGGTLGAGVGGDAIGGGGAGDGAAGAGLGEPIRNTGRSAPQSDPYKTPKVKGENKTPNQDLITLGQALITAATLLVMMAAMFKKLADGDPESGWMIAAWITGGIAFVAAVAAVAIGVTLLAKGQAIQGAIITVIGTILAVLAAIVTVDAFTAESGASTAVETGSEQVVGQDVPDLAGPGAVDAGGAPPTHAVAPVEGTGGIPVDAGGNVQLGAEVQIAPEYGGGVGMTT